MFIAHSQYKKKRKLPKLPTEKLPILKMFTYKTWPFSNWVFIFTKRHTIQWPALPWLAFRSNELSFKHFNWMPLMDKYSSVHPFNTQHSGFSVNEMPYNLLVRTGPIKSNVFSHVHAFFCTKTCNKMHTNTSSKHKPLKVSSVFNFCNGETLFCDWSCPVRVVSSLAITKVLFQEQGIYWAPPFITCRVKGCSIALVGGGHSYNTFWWSCSEWSSLSFHSPPISDIQPGTKILLLSHTQLCPFPIIHIAHCWESVVKWVSCA